MNSALQPVLTKSSQNPTVSGQISKPMHPQGAPSYSQPSGHMAQNPYPNMNVAHNHPNAQPNHFSLNVPNTTPHFIGGNMGSIPPSNHPVANIGQATSGQIYTPPKNVSYSGGYQPNLGHPPNQNIVPPVSQTLPATSQSQQNSSSQNSSNSSNSSTPSSEASVDKPQSNGTPEVKSPPKVESQSSFVAASRDKPPTPVPSQVPQVALGSGSDKCVDQPIPTPPVQEQKHLPEVKVQEEPKASTSSPTIPTTESNVSSTVASSSSNSQSQSLSSINNPIGSTESTKSPSEKETKTTVLPTPEVVSVPLKETASAPQEISETATSPEAEKDSKSKEDCEIENTSDESVSVNPITESVQVLPSTPVFSKSKEQSPKKEQSPLRLATTSRTPLRKSKTPKPEELPKTPKAELKTPVQKSPSTGKAKRQRIRTQPYQCPLPEIEIITKNSSSTPRRNRTNDEKLIYFYKNEFLAVRNAEGGFYLCQAVQNIYKSTSKIKIRWLSQDKNDKSGEIYTPDFYDLTDFDCILTSLDLSRVDKGRYRLTPAEKERTDSILKRCLAVEKGEISTPSVSEEHPDGLDLSLYKDEEQLKKRKTTKRKATPPSKSAKSAAPSKKSPQSPKVRKVEAKPAPKSVKKPTVVVKKTVPVQTKKATTSTSRAARGKRKSDAKTSPVVDQKKAKVLARIGRKTIPSTASRVQAPNKNTKAPKPTPSSSKSVKSSTTASKVTATRKTKRSTRK